MTVYEYVGGMPFFERLVGRFYDEVEADPVLLSLYPDRDDLGQGAFPAVTALSAGVRPLDHSRHRLSR